MNRSSETTIGLAFCPARHGMLATLFLASVCLGYTRDEILRNISGRLTQPSFAYQADIHTRVYIGERSSTDSGTVLFSPPTCYRMTMAVSKV